MTYKGMSAEYTGKKSYEDGTKGPRGWYYEIRVTEPGEYFGYTTWTKVAP